MLQSVRRVLKGVADGDVLLDEEFQILEEGRDRCLSAGGLPVGSVGEGGIP